MQEKIAKLETEVKIIKKEGVFVREDGTEFPYKNFKIKFCIGENPLVFEAKLDKIFNDYIEDALNEVASF